MGEPGRLQSMGLQSQTRLNNKELPQNLGGTVLPPLFQLPVLPASLACGYVSPASASIPTGPPLCGRLSPLLIRTPIILEQGLPLLSSSQLMPPAHNSVSK